MWNKKELLRYILIAFIVCVVATIIIPQSHLSWRISNGLFFAGMLLLLIGAFRFIKYLGAFDLITYTVKKLSKYSEKDVDGYKVEDVGEYHEYLMSMHRKKDFGIPIAIGTAALFLSALLSLSF